MADRLTSRIAARAQHALGVDDLRTKLDLVLGRVERIPTMELTLNGLAVNFAFTKETLLQRLQGLQELADNLHLRARRTEDQLRRLADFVERSMATVREWNSHTLVGEPWIPDSQFVGSKPEHNLAVFLYNFLPNRVMLDVGANQGAFAELAARTGFRVLAFEPYAPAFAWLEKKTAARPSIRVFNYALGSLEGSLPFYVAGEEGSEEKDESLYNTFKPRFLRRNIRYPRRIEVPIRTIERLVQEGEVPAQIDYLKIDTEGFDLEVMRGLGATHPLIVQSACWGEDFLSISPEPVRDSLSLSGEMVEEMRSRDYFWNLVIFRMESDEYIHFATNLAEVPRSAWGNILFFRQHELFLAAFQWCQSVLPRLRATSEERAIPMMARGEAR